MSPGLINQHQDGEIDAQLLGSLAALSEDPDLIPNARTAGSQLSVTAIPRGLTPSSGLYGH